jgi:DNA-binding CsgD family transcriptional regulator
MIYGRIRADIRHYAGNSESRLRHSGRFGADRYYKGKRADAGTSYRKGELKIAGVNAGVNAGVKLSKTQIKIIELITKNNAVTQAGIAQKLKINESTVYRNIEKLNYRIFRILLTLILKILI